MAFSIATKIAEMNALIVVSEVKAVFNIVSGIVTSISHVEMLLNNFCLTFGLITGANLGS